ncbi:MAG: glycosyltransferase family 9 protein [Oscillatoriales cyanobacterium C42_A2020_001]|nr:glycosyltransferase family 9 protein [Leptolyngbyaceae cyanobacterium C42_A2020_001]
MISGIQRILFVECLGGIGDVVIALPAIHAIAQSHPSAQLTVLTFAPGGELLESDPLIHRVVYTQPGQVHQVLDQLLTHELFDLIISDTNYDGIADRILQTSAKHTITNLWRSPPSDQRVSDRFLQILFQEEVIESHQLSQNLPQIHLKASEKLKARQLFGAAFRPLIFLIVDAGMPIKRWSVANFMALGQAFSQQGATIVIPEGSIPTEARQIANGIGKTAQTVPKCSLRDLAALIAEADLAIAADTGLARIATALNVPSITLFGPSWHGRYGQPTPHINLQGYPNCPERIIQNFTDQSCWYSGHCPYDWNTCMDDISPETVLAAAIPLLEKKEREKVRDLSPQPATPISTLSPFRSPAASWQSVRNLLVMRLDNIGDVIMTSPALQALKENLPNAKITLMASPSGSLTSPLLPAIDEVMPYRVLWQDLGRLEFNPLREWALIETLKQQQFNAAIIFTSFAQSPHPAAFICALAGIPLRLGESKEQDLGTLTHAVPPAPDEIHQVERNLRLIESIGFEVRDRRLLLNVPASRFQIAQPYILLNPWTSCQSRNYAADRFAIAASQLSKMTGWVVVVTGVEKDRVQASPLLEMLGDRAIDLIGQTTLAELVALVAQAKLVLTNNTSTMHIADATRTPNVVLFAGTERECQWQPRHSPSRLLRRPTVCSPCYAFTCPYQLECLDLTPDAVVEAALELLPGVSSVKLISPNTVVSP